MLPRAEIENLLNAVFEAVDMAAEGRAADSYSVLLLGRQKALVGEANFEPTGRRGGSGVERRYPALRAAVRGREGVTARTDLRALPSKQEIAQPALNLTGMPLGKCVRCQRVFITWGDAAPERGPRGCPHCSVPLQKATLKDARAVLAGASDGTESAAER